MKNEIENGIDIDETFAMATQDLCVTFLALIGQWEEEGLKTGNWIDNNGLIMAALGQIEFMKMGIYDELKRRSNEQPS